MTNQETTTATNYQKGVRPTTIMLVARHEDAAFSRIDYANPTKPQKCYTQHFDSESRDEKVFNLGASIINQCVEKGVNLNLITLENLAIASYKFAKAWNSGEYFDAEELVPATYDEFRKKAYLNFLAALQNAREKEIIVNVSKVSELNHLNLIIPQGVEVKEGEILQFKDGKARDGISVSGWKNFNRQYAKVEVKRTENRETGEVRNFYYLRNETRNTQTERMMAKSLWAKCPAGPLPEIQFEEVVQVA